MSTTSQLSEQREYSAASTRKYRSHLTVEKKAAIKLADKASKKHWRDENPVGQMLIEARKRAKKKQLPFTLVHDDIQIPNVCPVLGLRLVRMGGKPTDASPSLDRVIPSLGYIKGNVRVISWRANDVKGNATVEELEMVVRYMKEANTCPS